MKVFPPESQGSEGGKMVNMVYCAEDIFDFVRRKYTHRIYSTETYISRDKDKEIGI